MKELKMVVKETKNECSVKFRDGWKFEADHIIVRGNGDTGVKRLHQYVMFNDRTNGSLFINVVDDRDEPLKNGITFKKTAKFMEKHYTASKMEHLILKILSNVTSAIEQYYPACINFTFTNMGMFTITTDLGVTLTNIKVKDDSMITEKSRKVQMKTLPKGETVDPDNVNIKSFKGVAPAEEASETDAEAMSDGYKKGM